MTGKVTLDKTGFDETMQTLHSWADDTAGKYYSGTATYVRTFEIPENVAHAGAALLDFGEGAPVERGTMNFPGMRTWFDPPLRDAAMVYVNGKLAGFGVASAVHAGYRAVSSCGRQRVEDRGGEHGDQ